MLNENTHTHTLRFTWMKSLNKNFRSSGCSRPVCFARLVYIPLDSCNKTLTQKAQKTPDRWQCYTFTVMFKWFDFLPRGLFTLKQLLTQYGLLYGQMSLCHTFSPVLHYTDSVTSSDTPIKAIQAKHCSSFLCWWDLLQSISVKFPLCLSTPVEISSFSFRIIGSKHYYKWTTDNLPFI